MDGRDDALLRVVVVHAALERAVGDAALAPLLEQLRGLHGQQLGVALLGADGKARA